MFGILLLIKERISGAVVIPQGIRPITQAGLNNIVFRAPGDQSRNNLFVSTSSMNFLWGSDPTMEWFRVVLVVCDV